MPHFDVLANKVIGGDVVLMEWCPTMDLLALVTSDSQLLVHRPVGWQRLFAHTGFDSPVTCLAWRPDGQVLAIGHANGAITLFGVEEGEVLGTAHEHEEPLTTFCWVSASEHNDPAAKDSPYMCLLDGLFAPLAQLPRQAAVQQYLLEESTPQLDVSHTRHANYTHRAMRSGSYYQHARSHPCPRHATHQPRPIPIFLSMHRPHPTSPPPSLRTHTRQVALYKLLFEAPASLAFDIAVTADAAARIHLAVHGRFSLGCLAIGALPALDFGAPPKLLAVKLAPALHALTVVVHTTGHAHALLADGTR